MSKKESSIKKLTKRTEKLKTRVESGKVKIDELEKAKKESDSHVDRLGKALIASSKKLTAQKIESTRLGKKEANYEKVITELEAKVAGMQLCMQRTWREKRMMKLLNQK